MTEKLHDGFIIASQGVVNCTMMNLLYSHTTPGEVCKPAILASFDHFLETEYDLVAPRGGKKFCIP